MVLGFLPVECVGNLQAVFIRQAYGTGGSQRDALVCRPVEHVLSRRVGHDPVYQPGIVTGQAAQQRSVTEQAGIEEIRADPSGFQGEFTERENLMPYAQINEFVGTLGHGTGSE